MKSPRVPDRVLAEPEPSRARDPDETGYAERDGVKIAYEVYGSGEPTLLFFYPWAPFHSRTWKAQIPYLSRHFRVVTFDQRGGGKSDRPAGVDAYRLGEHAADVLAVMDATKTERAVLVTISIGARVALWLAANHPDRVQGIASVGPYTPLTRWPTEQTRLQAFFEPRAWSRARILLANVARNLGFMLSDKSARRFSRNVKFLEALKMFNAHAWLRDQAGFLQWFVSMIAIHDEHSTMQAENAVRWGLETDPQTMLDSFVGIDVDERAIMREPAEIREYCARVRCPVLVIHGDEDLAAPPEWGAELARITGGRLLRVPGTGHDVRGRKPVVANLALREFAAEVLEGERIAAEARDGAS